MTPPRKSARTATGSSIASLRMTWRTGGYCTDVQWFKSEIGRVRGA